MGLANYTFKDLRLIGNSAMEISNIEEFQQEIVPRLSDLFRASAAAVIHWAEADSRPENLRKRDIFFYQMDQHYKDIYFHQVRSIDPISECVLGGGQATTPGISTLSSIISADELKTNLLYQRILCPLKHRDVLTISFSDNRHLLGNISLVRSNKTPFFDQQDLQHAQLLMPMLSASYAKLLFARELKIQKDMVCALRSELTASPADKRASVGQSLGLTRREIQIVQSLSDGLSSKEIGRQLSISPWTVKNHLQSVYEKAGVNTRIGLLNRLSLH